MRRITLLCVLASAALVIPAAWASPAVAVVPVDPGPSAAGKPIWATGQNLPPLIATGTYFVGPGFAPQVIDYYDSGQATKDQRDVVNAADVWVDAWIDKHCDGQPRRCKAAVVFDVDETLLSNYAFYLGTDFTFNQDGWNAFNQACDNAVNAPVRRVYNHFRDAGLRVVIMTGRAESARPWTAACLRERGIFGWDRLILKSAAEQSLTAEVYKAQERAKLQRAGYRIVASIGDQVSDMAGGHLKSGFLLPNPIYLIP